MADIKIETSDGAIDAVLAVPGGTGPWPGVVLIHDGIGLRNDHRKIIEDIAGHGYLVIAPNLFARGGMVRCIKRVFSDLQAHKGQAVEDILAARDTLRARADCTGKVGIAGFCLGGGFALLVSPKGFDASAPFYPSIQSSHYESILDGACPIVSSHGSRDPIFGTNAAAKLEASLTARGVAHDVKVYEGAGHSFADVKNPILKVTGLGYNEQAADDAWARVYAFFETHLR